MTVKVIDCKAKVGAAAWTLFDENELIAAVQTYKAMKREQAAYRAALYAKTREFIVKTVD